MQSTIFLVLMTSCLNFLVAAEKQSAHTASSHFGASLAQTSTQQQQNHQRLQQHISSRLSHIAQNQQPFGGESQANASRHQFITSNQFKNKQWDSDQSFGFLPSDISLRTIIHGHTKPLKYSSASERQYKTGNFKNDAVLFRNPISSDWSTLQLPYNKQLFKNKNNLGDMSISSQGHSESKVTHHDDHRLDKREADASFPVSDEEAVKNFLDENYPIYLDRRFQMFRPTNAAVSSPYLSAQEFKETFRRSDPYFMGKRTTDSLPDEYTPFAENKRAAPMFVGRRDAPYFVGKRGAPVFIGKRFPVFAMEDDTLLPIDYERNFPQFIERRGAPYFVGKRESSNFEENPWSEMSPEDQIKWILENKKGAPKFVGRRGAPYFVGKRGPPIFVGKRVPDFELDDGDFSIVGNRGQVARLLGRRGSPYFVGKRGSPRFIGKRSAHPIFQNQAPSFLAEKRRAPTFVGRRGSPYFVGKRGPPRFVGKRLNDLYFGGKSLLEDKRGAPNFVGRRGAPYFVGKREPLQFDGKLVPDLEWFDTKLSLSEDKRGSSDFVERRGAPYFVGKRGAPMFVGKRTLGWLEDDTNKATLGKENNHFVKEINGLMAQIAGNNISQYTPFLAESNLAADSHHPEWENLSHLQTIQDLKARIQDNQVQEPTGAVGSKSQSTVAEETEEQR